MPDCDCGVAVKNLGKPNCFPTPEVTTKLIIVPLFANDGTRNQIVLATDTPNAAFWDGKANEADDSKRYFPTPPIDNIEDVRADSIFETLNSGQNIKIQKGPRTWNGMFVECDTVFLGKLEGAGCTKIGVYVVDVNGGVQGNLSSDGLNLEPIAVDIRTWDPKLVPTSDSVIQKIQLIYEYSRTMQDKNIRVINASEIDGINLATDYEGLLDVNPVVTGISTTGFTVTQTLDYGSAFNPIPVEGWVIGDYTLAETSPTPGPIVITSVTETPANSGIYVFVIPAATANDVLLLTASKTGFDFPDTSITIPV